MDNELTFSELIKSYVEAPTPEKAQQIFVQYSDILISDEADEILQQLIEQATENGNHHARIIYESRRAMLQEYRRNAGELDMHEVNLPNLNADE